jgi:hypothetical protein
VAGVIWAVVSVCVGLMQEGPSEPITAPRLPVIPSAFDGLPTGGAGPASRAPGLSGLPGGWWSGEPLFPSLQPRIPTPSLCLLLQPEIRSGRGLSQAERREAGAAIGDFLCGLMEGDPAAAFAGTGTPSATQRSWFAALDPPGPTGPVTILDVDTGSAGRRRVTAVLQTASGAGGRPACLRFRLTVTRSGDGISSMTAPVRVGCP